MANDFKRMWTKEEIEGMGGGVSEEQFEELVRATPTEVSIIEDQGKLELMLEHDGNVLAVNDTPNQFLQRRLYKSSLIVSLPKTGTNFILYDISMFRVGTIVRIDLSDVYGTTHNYYGIVTKVYGEHLGISLMTLGEFTIGGLNYYTSQVDINTTNTYINAISGIGDGAGTQYLTTSDFNKITIHLY